MNTMIVRMGSRILLGGTLILTTTQAWAGYRPAPHMSTPSRPSFTPRSSGYSSPRPNFSAPSYSAPRMNFSPPRSNFSPPRMNYNSPRMNYAAPRAASVPPAYRPPTQTFNRPPSLGYNQPSVPFQNRTSPSIGQPRYARPLVATRPPIVAPRALPRPSVSALSPQRPLGRPITAGAISRPQGPTRLPTVLKPRVNVPVTRPKVVGTFRPKPTFPVAKIKPGRIVAGTLVSTALKPKPVGIPIATLPRPATVAGTVLPGPVAGLGSGLAVPPTVLPVPVPVSGLSPMPFPSVGGLAGGMPGPSDALSGSGGGAGTAVADSGDPGIDDGSFGGDLAADPGPAVVADDGDAIADPGVIASPGRFVSNDVGSITSTSVAPAPTDIPVVTASMVTPDPTLPATAPAENPGTAEPSPADALITVTRTAVLGHPGDPGGAVAEVAGAFDVKDLDGKTVAAQAAFLRDGWASVPSKRAQELANQGRLVIAAQPGRSVIRIGVVVPGTIADGKFPRVAIVNPANSAVPSAEGVRADQAFLAADLDGLRYFTPGTVQ